jgi:hypothetical protein
MFKLPFVLLLLQTSANALDASDFSELVGWTQVDGEFEGCDTTAKSNSTNGWTLTCDAYSYSYAYNPDAVIFVKTFTVKGRAYWSVNALIDDEFYEMKTVPAKRSR